MSQEFTKEQRLQDLFEIQRLELGGLEESRRRMLDCGKDEKKVESYLKHFNRLAERTRNRSEDIEDLRGDPVITADVHL